MISGLLNIVVGAAVSFAGSLPVGILNVNAIQIGWSRGIRAVLYFALACALIEAAYGAIAIMAAQTLIHTPDQRTGSQLISIVILLAGGIYYWRKRPAAEPVSSALNVFIRGIMLSLVNVVAIPFWAVYTSVLENYRWIYIDHWLSLILYILGIALGTSLALLTFGRIGKQAGRHLNIDIRLINKGIGFALFGAGVAQVVWIMY